MTRAAAAVSALLLLVAGCGGGGSQSRQAAAAKERRPGCQASVRAALAGLPGTVSSRLVSGDAQTATCAYRSGGERLTVEVDSIPQAYLAYETANVHQVQANVARSDAATPDEYPKQVDGVGVGAAWIPSERQLIATNGTRRRGGAFVRVTLRHRAKGAPPDRTVGTRVARAALRTAPRGP